MLLFILSMNSYEQELSSDFKTITVNKRLSDFPDKFDLSSPLNSFITINYIFINGKDRLLRAVCSAGKKSLCPDSTAADSPVSDDIKNLHLNAVINEIVLYKNSVAFVISHMISEEKESYFSIRSFYLELGNWVNNGEDLRDDLTSARLFVRNGAELFFENFQWIQKNFYPQD